MKLILSAIALAALVVGCGGGGGGGDGSGTLVDNKSATGLWTGTTNTNRAVTGVVLSDGTYYVLYSSVGNSSAIAGVVQGTGSVSGSTFASSNGRDFNLEGAGVIPATITATVATKQSFGGTVTYSGSSTTFNSTYNPNFEVTPTLSALAGSYSGNVALSVGIQAATVNVSSTGAISGGGSGCSISGTVTPRTDGNVYDLSLTFGPSPCFFAGQTFSGIVYYDAAVKRLYAAAPNAGRTDGVLFVGVKP